MKIGIDIEAFTNITLRSSIMITYYNFDQKPANFLTNKKLK